MRALQALRVDPKPPRPLDREARIDAAFARLYADVFGPPRPERRQARLRLVTR